MRAAVFVGTGEPLSIEEVTPLPPGPRDVVVEVGASGVCHTDVAIACGQLPMPPPQILGHEVAGTVVAVGPAVSNVRVGDRVVGAGIPSCMACWYCVREQTHLCERTYTAAALARATRRDGTTATAFGSLGGFAELMTVDESSVVAVHTDLPIEQLALLGCAVMTGVGAALNTARIIPGSTVTVVGCGGVGQCVVQGARIAGASRIFAVDPVALKREAAAEQGATDVIDPADGDPVEQIRSLTEGRGTDYSLEVVGLVDTISTAYRCARRGGVVTLVGMPAFDTTVSFPGLELFLDAKELRVSVIGSGQIRRDFPRLVGLAETGRLDLASMISRRMDLDGVNDALDAMEAGEVVRSVITP